LFELVSDAIAAFPKTSLPVNTFFYYGLSEILSGREASGSSFRATFFIVFELLSSCQLASGN